MLVYPISPASSWWSLPEIIQHHLFPLQVAIAEHKKDVLSLGVNKHRSDLGGLKFGCVSDPYRCLRSIQVPASHCAMLTLHANKGLSLSVPLSLSLFLSFLPINSFFLLPSSS